MKTDVTRLLIGTLPGERRPDHALARRQVEQTNKPKTKAQLSAELVAFRRNINKLSVRQLKGLHSRLSARLGKAKLASLVRQRKASK